MTKKNIIFTIIVILVVAGGIFYFYKFQTTPTKISFGAAQRLSPDGFETQIVKLYGIDKKYGLDINFIYNEPGLTMTKLLNRELDVAIMAPVSAAKASLEGKNIRIFGPLLWNVISLAVPKESPYTKIEELKGKKLGILPQITASYTNMALLAYKKGWKLESDFQLVIGSLEDQIKFLKNRDVDLSVIYEPRSSMLFASGDVREIATMDDLWNQLTGQRFLFNGPGAYDDWINSHKKEARNLVKVFLEANRFIKDNPDLIEKHKDLLGLQSNEELSLAKKRIPFLFPTEWNQASVENIDSLVKIAVEAGFINRVPEKSIAVVLE